MAIQPWSEFIEQFAKQWRPGEHVFVYGETESGKTDLSFRLLNARPYGVAFITKPRDPIFRSSLTRGYRRVHSWPPRQVDKYRNNHFLLSAKSAKTMTEEKQNQRETLPPAFDVIYKDGGWTVLIDETLHLSNSLGMDQQLRDFAYLSRSNYLTGIYCSQRPKNIPVIIPQSCKYAFMARCRRADDIAVLSELGMDRRALRQQLNSLEDKHDFLFVDAYNGGMQVVNTHA